MDEVLTKLMIAYIIIMNIITFVLYGVDKYKAKHNCFRIPETVLLLWGYFGGAYGASLGMKIWRHKTRKWKFRIAVPISVVFVTVVLLMMFFFWGFGNRK